MIRYALVRAPGPRAAQGITSQSGPPLQLDLLKHQHAAYCRMLADLGVELIHLDPLTEHPDAYFVEDTAVVTPELAVIARPGAPQRRGEVHSVARVLRGYRDLKTIQAPGTLDGGDVMIVARHVFVGLSERTNRSGADQLARFLTPLGYRSTTLVVDNGLHLKTSVNSIGDDRLLISAAWADRAEFAGYRLLRAARDEMAACNTLAVNGHLIVPTGFPKTRDRLASNGLPLLTLDISQVRRMDGGLTCLSIRF